MEYLILDGKTPTHKFKDHGVSWKEAKDFDNVGLIVPSGYLVLDFDTTSDAEIMLKIIEALDLKTRVIKTTRGIHCYFKAGNVEKSFTKNRLAIGIYSDCKNSNKRSYVKIKTDGEMRPVLRKCDFKDMMEIPRWLYPVSAPANQFAFKEMGEGSGRNQELFNYIVYLQSKGFKKDEIKEAITVINEFVFAEPLPDHELKTILRDEAFKPEEEIQKQIEETKAKTKKWAHNEFADNLINAFNIITVNGQLYIYDDGYYQQDERIIERKMIDLYPSIMQKQRNEVLAYIRIKTHIPAEDLKVNPYIINLKNTRLDIRTGNALPFNHEAIEFDRIPVTYDPSAYCADTDKVLNKVFLGDRAVINLFEEMLGACIIKHSRYQKGFILYGGGSNGKSTILDMIKRFLGKNNYSTIELDKLTTDKFAAAELENKLANIGDDINNSAIKDTGTLKKLLSGDSLLVQRKNERPFMLEPYATHIFSANQIPRSFDKTQGFYRRWIFIPFNAVFDKTDPDYDPMIEDKLTTDNALSYMLNLAIRGAQRLMKNRGFTEPASVREALEQYINENSTTLSWIDDAGITLDSVLETSTDQLYSDFVDWCKNSGIKSAYITGKKGFYNELIQKFDLEKKPRQRHTGKRYFVLNLD